MPMKYAGAMLIILGCGGFGCAMAASCRAKERMLFQFRELLQYMYCELQFHMTPLPRLCCQTSKQGKGILSRIFLALSRELDSCREPDVFACMARILRETEISPDMAEMLLCLGRNLGCFDLEGQLRGLEALRLRCTGELEKLAAGRDERLRSYQTLGLCAGAALVILFV